MVPKTKHMPGKFEDAWDEGVWLGFDMRSNENLIGTTQGLVLDKCGGTYESPMLSFDMDLFKAECWSSLLGLEMGH